MPLALFCVVLLLRSVTCVPRLRVFVVPCSVIFCCVFRVLCSLFRSVPLFHVPCSMFCCVFHVLFRFYVPFSIFLSVFHVPFRSLFHIPFRSVPCSLFNVSSRVPCSVPFVPCSVFNVPFLVPCPVPFRRSTFRRLFLPASPLPRSSFRRQNAPIADAARSCRFTLQMAPGVRSPVAREGLSFFGAIYGTGNAPRTLLRLAREAAASLGSGL